MPERVVRKGELQRLRRPFAADAADSFQ